MSRSYKAPWVAICGARGHGKRAYKRAASGAMRARLRNASDIENAPTRGREVSNRFDWLDWRAYKPGSTAAYRK